MIRLEEHNGIHDGEGFFEYAYGFDDRTIRARFRVVDHAPVIASSVNVVPVASLIVVDLSLSLVDEQGQVIELQDGTALIQDIARHTWAPDANQAADFDEDDWLDSLVAEDAQRLFQLEQTMRARKRLTQRVQPVDAPPTPLLPSA